MQLQANEEILTTNDDARWREVLDEIGTYDFYHLPSFHRLAESRGEGSAIMPVFRDGEYTMAFPMVLRDIDLPGCEAARSLKDATSVCGFAGPLASHHNLPESVIQGFQDSLQGFFASQSIISAYSRLNPLTFPHDLLRDYGKIVDVGVTLAIDLSVPDQQQFANYWSGHRSSCRQLCKQGFVCEEAGPEHIGEFMRIYYETMDRVEADKAFYFDESYFNFLMSEMSDVVHLFICKKDNQTVAAGLFALAGGIVQYHLSGSDERYLRVAPTKLVIDYARTWANQNNARVFHLGGGVSGRRDSLYKFKAGFGAHEHAYSTWKHIVDHQTYNDICQELRNLAGKDPDNSYFPEYRNPQLLAHTHS